MKYKVKTLFDITATGVTGHFKSARAGFAEKDSWDRARNQQRNFETIQQLLSLRTNIFNITDPIRNGDFWEFEFEVESDGVYGNDQDPLGILRGDAVGVPMLIQLDNIDEIDSILIVGGPSQNIWFEPMPINTILEKNNG